MTKKELARLLGVSASIVSRHAKAGMPTDTIERAQKWRKRHLEPARVKGARSNASPSPSTQPPNPAAAASPQKTRAGDSAQPSIESIEALARMANTALTNAPASSAAAIVAELRVALRGLTSFDVNLHMSMRVWLALVSWWMHPEAEERQTTDLEPVLTPNEFCARVSAPGLGRIGVVWLDVACDWDGYSITGWPVGRYLDSDDEK